MRRARCRSKRVHVCTRVCPCDPNWCTKTEQVCIGTKKMSSGLHSLVRYHSMIIELSELCSSVKVGSQREPYQLCSFTLGELYAKQYFSQTWGDHKIIITVQTTIKIAFYSNIEKWDIQSCKYGIFGVGAEKHLWLKCYYKWWQSETSL